MTQEVVRTFWKRYLDTLPDVHPHRLIPLPEAWAFGDSPAMADELLALVLSGTKTATCGRYEGDNLLDHGGPNILLDGAGIPRCVIDVHEVTIKHFNKVDAEWAAAEGEGDLSLQYWQDGHRRFFLREAEQEGYTFTESMLLTCERFRVLFVAED
ncbi:MAG: ASCH domain-containing protein [Deinococcota bacterium]